MRRGRPGVDVAVVMCGDEEPRVVGCRRPVTRETKQSDNSGCLAYTITLLNS